MNAGWLSLVMIVGLSAPPLVARPEDPAVPPPAGSAADRALYAEGLEITNGIRVERSRATRLQLVLANLHYLDRLQAMARRGGEHGEHAARIVQRVNGAHARQFATLTARWPVDPTRGCAYAALDLGSLLSDPRSDAGDVAKHRALLRGCVAQARSATSFMRESNDELEAALRKAGALLAEADEHRGRDAHAEAGHPERGEER